MAQVPKKQLLCGVLHGSTVQPASTAQDSYSCMEHYRDVALGSSARVPLHKATAKQLQGNKLTHMVRKGRKNVPASSRNCPFDTMQ